MMSRKWLGALVGSLALTGVLGTLVANGTPGSQAAPLATATFASSDLPRREVSGEVESPAISFIDSPSPTCYRPVAGTGACYIQWNYLYVTADTSSYIISMTVMIDGRLRAYHSGFFQTSMFVPGQMYGPGFKVTCGFQGAGGISELGNTYNYTIRARETSGNAAANYGSVTCPPDVVNDFMPLILKH
jgi:hypothetical protein